MVRADKNDPIGKLERELLARGIDCVRERFRVPACPQITASAGYLVCATGAFLLGANYPAGAFLVGISGALLLVLSACGFSPVDWLGPKERRSVLVVPGKPSEENRKALFLAVPLACRLTSSGYFSREAAVRRSLGALGLLLALGIPIFAAAATLRYLPSFFWAGGVAGAAITILAAGEWARGKPAASPRNLAADWVGRSVACPGTKAQPYLLVYTGDEAEVKFFLAKYRKAVWRGQGVFVEFAEGSCGPAAVTVREGPFLLPYRVDPALFAKVRAAGKACGVFSARTPTLRFASGGLAAMSRGFQAVTLFRAEAPEGAEQGLSDERAAAWLAEITAAGCGSFPPKGGGKG